MRALRTAGTCAFSYHRRNGWRRAALQLRAVANRSTAWTRTRTDAARTTRGRALGGDRRTTGDRTW